MRLRARIIYKLLVLTAACLIILFIFLNTFEKNSTSAEFLTILRNTNEDVSTEVEPTQKITVAQIQHPQPLQLLNLTNFEFLVGNELCDNYKKELMGKI